MTDKERRLLRLTNKWAEEHREILDAKQNHGTQLMAQITHRRREEVLEILLEETVYVIDDGKTFEGNLEQFQECFFSYANDENIAQWCEDQDMKLEIRRA